MHLKSAFQLLQHAKGDVYGLQRTAADVEPLLAEFAAGRLDEVQRKKVCAWLRRNPERISEIAAAVKQKRSDVA